MSTEGRSDELSAIRLDTIAAMVSAYFSNHQVSMDQIPTVIGMIGTQVDALISPTQAVEEPVVSEPAVPIRKSVTPDFIICLEDGLKFKSLKRHLRTKYNMSPEEYRAKWGLAKDYPMVAPNYAKARSDLAKKMGLGQGGRKPAAQASSQKRTTKKTSEKAPEPAEAAAEA